MKNFLLTFMTLLLYIVCSVFTANSQSLYHRVVTISFRDSLVKTNLYQKNKDIAAKPELTYYWFSRNEIHTSSGGYSGKLLDGKYTSFYINGNLLEKGHFKRGVKTGEWLGWYDNGSLKYRSALRMGKLHGKSEYYDSKGNKISSIIFKKGSEVKKRAKLKFSPLKKVHLKKYFIRKKSGSHPKEKKTKTSQGKKKSVKKNEAVK